MIQPQPSKNRAGHSFPQGTKPDNTSPVGLQREVQQEEINEAEWE